MNINEVVENRAVVSGQVPDLSEASESLGAITGEITKDMGLTFKVPLLVTTTIFTIASFIAPAQAGAIRVPLQWDPLSAVPTSGGGFILSVGTIRPGFPTNDISALNVFGNIVITNATITNATVFINGVGLGDTIGFVLRTTTENNGNGFRSDPSNIPTIFLNSQEWLKLRVTNSLSGSQLTSGALGFDKLGAPLPSFRIEMVSDGLGGTGLRTVGHLPGEKFTFEAALDPAGPYQVVATNVIGGTITTTFDPIFDPGLLPNAIFYRAKRQFQ